MSTKWAVTAAANRVVLDDRREGETVFTVTNSGPAADQVVFEVVPDEGADASWFSVAEPRRLIRGGASVSYVVKLAVPADAPSGTYAVRPLVYSADGTPEESSVTGPRVSLEVTAAGEVKPSRRWPWWWFAVAGLVVVVLVVVIALVATRGEEVPPSAQPTPNATAPSGAMPDVVGLTEQEARRLLEERAILVESRYLHDPERIGTVLAQSVPPGESVGPAGVTLDIAVALQPSVLIEPIGVVTGMTRDAYLELVWEPGELASSWNVILFFEYCTFTGQFPNARRTCHFVAGDPVRDLDTPSYRLPAEFGFPYDPEAYFSGWFQWQVEPLDADGNPGPASEPVFVRIGDIRL